MRAHFLQKIFLFLLVHNSEFLENLSQELLYQTTFWCGLVLNGLKENSEVKKFLRISMKIYKQNFVYE